MDVGSDFIFLADEKFDFDISLSPSSSAKEDAEDCDDEVFTGPVKHKEKCVSAAIQLHDSDIKTPSPKDEQAVWSPLSGDKFVEIFKEAHLLALQLECSTNDDKKEEAPQTVPNQTVEKFVQESKSKLKLFDTFNGVNKTPIAIKRETYCIQESPIHQLPPSIQKHIIGPNKHVERTDAQRSQNVTGPVKAPKVVKNLTVSPLTQKTRAPQGKSTVPALSNGKTVSRLQPMKATAAQSKTNRLTVEKPKVVKKISPARRKNMGSMGSTEDLLSGNSSIASDISDSSLNNSCIGQNKRTLTLPNKVNLGKPQFKTPSAASNLRKNTSSSSSSHSSVNTSLNSSLSSPPAASATLNASLNASLNTSVNGSKFKPNTSRLALVRPLGGVGSALKMASVDSSNNRLKPNMATKPNGNKPASVSMAQPQTPAGKIQRQTSAPNLHRLLPPCVKPESAVKAVPTKQQARILPTPKSRLKPPQKQEGLSPDHTARRALKPTRLLSCGDIGSDVHSTPIGSVKGMQVNSSVLKSISATPSSKLASTLPTPISRKTSGMLTPRTVPRAIPSLRPTPALQASSKASKTLVRSAESEKNVRPKLVQNPSSPNEDTSIAEVCCSLNFSPDNKHGSEKEHAVPMPQHSEVLLIDIEIEKPNTKMRKQTLTENDSQPLIDLSNTPELNRQPVPLKPTSISQLIDLSSPLIKLSPAANKENMDSPLLKF